MPDIQILAPHVADLIAAGEVVERPASVVKELVENAMDAGATAVTVEIQRGGMALIRVTDNGCGIPHGACRTAFLRHATSKLQKAEDLAAIGTLGFRGEALAAIAAVSRVELFTRTAEEEMGTTLFVEGGIVQDEDETGCPQGTTMVVRDLFFNTPARLKFMKRDSAEGAAVFAQVQKLALSHPELSVRFIRDGRQDLHTPGDGTLGAALYAVLGRDLAPGYFSLLGEGEDVSVSGYVTLPVCCRGTRSHQYFFVNGRSVVSKTLTAALERAYENQKMVGKFPGCVLFLRLPANTVDVNVHPAKTEIKFLRENAVFSGVYGTVREALEARRTHPDALPQAMPEAAAPEQRPPEPPRSAGAQPLRSRSAAALADPPPAGDRVLLTPLERELDPDAFHRPPTPSPHLVKLSTKPTGKSTGRSKNVDKAVETVENPLGIVVESQRTPQDTPISPISAEDTAGEGLVETDPPPTPEPDHPDPAEAQLPLVPEAGPAPWRLVGEVLRTYLIVEQGDRIFWIDKHAAHERMQFDRMKAQGYTPMVQTLLTPVIVRPSPEEAAVLLAHLPLLTEFGFDCSSFGGDALAVRAVPDYVEPGQAEAVLGELAEELALGGADPASARDVLLHTMACKAAIKGGQNNSRDELLPVAEAVVSGAVYTCPHGRPVAITMTRKQLEKQFKRI